MGTINHLVVLMMENRSFDHVLGALRLNGQKAVNGITEPLRTNSKSDGTAVPQWCMDGQPYSYNVPHGLNDVKTQYDNGLLDGFVRAMEGSGGNPKVPMGYYTAATFPVLYQLAQRFTVCDRWFSSTLSSTWPNRKYFHSGTRDVDDDTQILPGLTGFQTTPLYEFLEKCEDPDRKGQHLTWRSYFTDLPFLAFWYRFAATHALTNFSYVTDFVDDCREGNLPHVAIVDPPFTLADDHPPHNPQLGEKFIGLIVDALTTSKSWADTALLIVFDEHGGFYDHEPPPAPEVPNKWNDTPYGFRVPAILVSPFANTPVSSTLYDHTSWLKTISERWGVLFDARFDTRWRHANSFLGEVQIAEQALAPGIYTGAQQESLALYALDWGSGVYERLQGELHAFEALLERIFVLPELKPLDNRAKVFETLGGLEQKVITQKRSFEHVSY